MITVLVSMFSLLCRVDPFLGALLKLAQACRFSSDYFGHDRLPYRDNNIVSYL